MALSFKNKIWVLAIALVSISSLSSKLGKTEEDFPQVGSNYNPAYGDFPYTGNGEEDVPQAGGANEQAEGDVPLVGAEHDPAQIVAKALLCFNDKYIYQSCDESYRLTQSGELNVPSAKVDQYCNGPCLQETHLVLNCIENILENFVFYNRATIGDIKDTIKAGCGFGPERGNFNVAQHIQAEGSTAHEVPKQILFGLSLIFIGHVLLL